MSVLHIRRIIFCIMLFQQLRSSSTLGLEVWLPPLPAALTRFDKVRSAGVKSVYVSCAGSRSRKHTCEQHASIVQVAELVQFAQATAAKSLGRHPITVPMAKGSSGTPTMGLATLMKVFGSTGVTLRHSDTHLSGHQEGFCPLPSMHAGRRAALAQGRRTAGRSCSVSCRHASLRPAAGSS